MDWPALVRNVEDEENGLDTMNRYLLYEERAPRVVVPDDDGAWRPWDSPDDEDGVPLLGGRRQTLIDPGFTCVWRGCREDRPRPNPADSMIYVDDGDVERFKDAVERIWPDLADDEWISVPIHESWQTSTILDHATSQVITINRQWFPPSSNWRGILLEIRYMDEHYTVQEHTVFSTGTRTPVSKQDFLIQIGLQDFRAQTLIEVNGVLLTSSSPPRLIGHGPYFFVNVIARNVIDDLNLTSDRPMETQVPDEEEAESSPLAYDPTADSDTEPSHFSYRAESASQTTHLGEKMLTPIWDPLARGLRELRLLILFHQPMVSLQVLPILVLSPCRMDRHSPSF
eukprot:Skav236530  [mRNA]  locus=scaffold78:1080036:1081058:- [translate_table: standard]